MRWTITTKQGETYEVSDDNVWPWVRLENDLGLTYSQAIEKIGQQSLAVISHLLWVLSKDAGKTDLPTAADWAKMQLDTFDVIDEAADPKAETA